MNDVDTYYREIGSMMNIRPEYVEAIVKVYLRGE